MYVQPSSRMISDDYFTKSVNRIRRKRNEDLNSDLPHS